MTAIKKHRVLHLISDLHVGGVGMLLLMNLPLIDPNRFENHLCYFAARNDLEPKFLEVGISPIALNHGGKRHALRSFIRLIRLIRGLKIDLVHTNLTLDGIIGRTAAFVCRVPIVTTLHATTVPTKMKWGRSWIPYFLEYCTERFFVRRFVAVSEAVSNVYVSQRLVPKEKVTVIYSGISPEGLRTDEARDPNQGLFKELGMRGSKPVLINVGRLNVQKGQHYLVPMMKDVVKRWPSAVLLIVGGGELRAELQEAVMQAGLEASIRFLGQRADVGELLSISDMFVFPSIFGEGLPVSVLEAMAAGLPVTAFKSGPLAEMVEDGVSGLLVKPNDPGALAGAVLKVLDNPQGAIQMGRRGREIAERKFNIEKSVRELENVYASVIGVNAGGR